MFKPMLATQVDFDKLKFPVMCSPKFDGIRALVINGEVVSRNLKPIPNRWVQESFGHHEGFDGELIYGDPADKRCFAKTTSACMTRGSMESVDYYVFDLHNSNMKYIERYRSLRDTVQKWQWNPYLKLVSQYLIPKDDVYDLEYDLESLLEYEQKYLKLGYEGIMLRDPNGLYKHGRSTAREGTLLKLKRFSDSEAEIIFLNELEHNDNVAEKDAFGRTKRSSRQEGKSGMDTLGSFTVRDVESGIKFNVGTGFTQEDRDEFWQNKEVFLNRVIKYKFQEVGSKDGVPRFPVFIGFRDERDMS